jgi:hypothetical protein
MILLCSDRFKILPYLTSNLLSLVTDLKTFHQNKNENDFALFRSF